MAFSTTFNFFSFVSFALLASLAVLEVDAHMVSSSGSRIPLNVELTYVAHTVDVVRPFLKSR
jgi:hypothetical protein